ncbi:hypothetical protein R6Q57_007460, partial [Mikania cordata]
TLPLQYNSEDDFELPKSKKSPQLNLQSTFIAYDIQRKVRIRNSPINLKTFIDLLNVKQKDAIKKIGFGSILNFKITSLSTCMGYWLLSNYNPTTNTLNLGSFVKITSKLVNQVLGIPIGSIQIKELNKPSKRDPIVAEFRSQFPDDIGLPEISHVKDLVKNSGDSGRIFELNFLVLFNTIMGKITQGSKERIITIRNAVQRMKRTHNATQMQKNNNAAQSQTYAFT